MEPLSSLTVDELADGICLRAGRIAAGQAELMTWIAEFDRREGWGGPGMLSCAHWLSWRIGLSPGAAREQVRVARRLEELPDVAAAFGDGRVSYSKVRAITRVAETDDGVDWVSLARHSSAAQLEKVVRGVRRAQAAEEAAADPELADWKVRTRKRYDRDGNLVITIVSRAEYAPVVEAGLDAKRVELQRDLDAQVGGNVPDEPPLPAAPDDQPPLPDVPAGTPAPDAADDVDADMQAPGWPEARRVGRPGRRVAPLSTAGAKRCRTSRTSPTGPTSRSSLASLTGLTGLSGLASLTGRTSPPSRPRRSGRTRPRTFPRERRTGPESATATRSWRWHSTPWPPRGRLIRTSPGDAGRTSLPGSTRCRVWGRQPDGELLPPTSLRAVMKTLPNRGGVMRLRPVTDADLRRLDLGRDRREVSGPLRELLGTIDGERCRFPGCTRHKKLHAHHVVFWSDGGPTDLANLTHLEAIPAA